MRVSRLLLSWFVLAGLLCLWVPGTVLAASDNTTEPPAPPPPPPEIQLNPTYPKLEATAGGNFEFEVEFRYSGDKERVFDIQATGPKNWTVAVTPQYEKDKKALAITLQPAISIGTKMKVIATPPNWPLPDPGNYQITVAASADKVKGSATLTAVITNTFAIKVLTPTGRYNTYATSGKDNAFSITVQNTGSAPVDSINLSSTSKPDGWAIDFKPDKVDSLNAGEQKTIDLNIKPPANTIAGDYTISLRASGKQASADDISLRVTVESPTVWGWVGVAIILVVIAGLISIFMRFSRR